MSCIAFQRYAVVFGALVLAACPGDDSSADSGADGLASTGQGPATSAGSGSTQGSASSVGSTGTGAVDSSGTGAGQSCGDMSCADDEYCDWDLDTCGEQKSEAGTCLPRPKACPAVYMPVCGCDGEVWGNACNANGAGVDVDIDGACEVPEDTFPCGPLFCQPGFEYCQVQVSDVGGFPDVYTCVQPAPCGTPQVDCSCLAREPCFDFSCEDLPDGGSEIICPGG
ncbi:MAG: hypothetical protein K0V04_28585 [Deltaproteobacteria bacterium]|nr:hypothetical protein [Deltaproteobacteria bacterium]